MPLAVGKGNAFPAGGQTSVVTVCIMSSEWPLDAQLQPWRLGKKEDFCVLFVYRGVSVCKSESQLKSLSVSSA